MVFCEGGWGVLTVEGVVVCLRVGGKEGGVGLLVCGSERVFRGVVMAGRVQLRGGPGKGVGEVTYGTREVATREKSRPFCLIRFG